MNVCTLITHIKNPGQEQNAASTPNVLLTSFPFISIKGSQYLDLQQ